MRAPDTADRLRNAAFDLFAAQGFEATTVDDIAQRAGVGRTTFFRHFRTKEDVVFPDHAGMVAAVVSRLAAARGDAPVRVVTEAALLVLDRYVSEGERARARYRLVTAVEPLRARELASTQPYQRAFGRYLREVLAEDPDGPVHAEVVAAAVIAAHNHVLRRWLRGESAEPERELREVLAEVFRRWLDPVAASTGSRSAGSTVLVLGNDLSAEEAASVVRHALGERARTVGADAGR
jgi:AcrR family transcriptional regulator